MAARPSNPARKDATPAAAAGTWRGLLRRDAVIAAVIFVLLVGVYHVNGGFLYGNDAKANIFLPVSLLSRGALSFDPDELPFMFIWAREEGGQAVQALFDRWDERVPGQPYTYQQLRDGGKVVFVSARYFVVPSIRKTPRGDTLYVNTFGPGAGLTALPVFGVLYLAYGGDLVGHTEALWYGGKLVAAMLVAGSAVFVFLTVRAFTTIWRSVLITAVYAVGTGVWPISSQTLWQHGPNGFFLAMGTYFLLRSGQSWRHAAWCGLAYSAAVACRPTSLLMALAAGVYLLVVCLMRKRPAVLAAYVLAALPIAAALAAYNAYYFGSPFEFGQAIVGHKVAMTKTGSTELWQTPIWLGAAGLMVSPSRGLLIYSPFMIFALGGMVVLWTRRRYAALWPVSLATLGLLAVAFMWFDWWGGWCYGPRPIVDTMPMLAVFLVPVIDWICRRKAVLAVFLVLAAWAVFVQGLGAFAYDLISWNEMPAVEVRLAGESKTILAITPGEFEALERTGKVVSLRGISMDIDEPANRHRLWSLSDNQIGFYVRYFNHARRIRSEMIATSSKDAWR